MNRTEKEQLVEELRSDLSQAKSVVLASHVGMDAATVNELRSSYRAEDVTYRVVKNTLIKIAIQDTDMAVISDMFRGPVAIAYSFEDAVSPARVARNFAKDHKDYKIIGAYLEGQRFEEAGVTQLADMPTKDELRAKFLGLLQAVPSKFVRTLNAVPQKMVMVLKAKADKDAA
ncbi:MAG: 50S ribosomal protein L10 [Myxococcota bacterium]|nr:50S ribosomal protein L10 [Myxococcota bacterium]MEC9441935.1 50S ribosomal protein L10 [Myxococcota bacterium]